MVFHFTFFKMYNSKNYNLLGTSMNTPHYAYQTLFEITSPDSLTDFWSYIINRLDLKSSELY